MSLQTFFQVSSRFLKFSSHTRVDLNLDLELLGRDIDFSLYNENWKTKRMIKNVQVRKQKMSTQHMLMFIFGNK